MKIQRAGQSGIALLLEAHELTTHGISWEDFTLAHARRWLRDALGTTVEPELIEAYKRDNDILVLARITQPTAYYYFSDFEALLLALHSIDTHTPADLYTLNGGYYLALTGVVSPQWQEFGTIWSGHPAYLTEHGKQLLRGNALSVLARHFAAL